MKKQIKVKVIYTPGWEERYIKALVRTVQNRGKQKQEDTR